MLVNKVHHGKRLGTPRVQRQRRPVTVERAREVAAAIVKHGSRRAAAEALDINQASVSTFLRLLTPAEREKLPKGKPGTRKWSAVERARASVRSADLQEARQSRVGRTDTQNPPLELKEEILARLKIVLAEDNWHKAVELVQLGRDRHLAAITRGRRHGRPEDDEQPDPATFPVSALNVPSRFVEDCERRGIHYVGGLLKLAEQDLLAWPNCAAVTLRLVRLALREAGLPPLERFNARQPASEKKPPRYSLADLEVVEHELALRRQEVQRLERTLAAMQGVE